MTHEEFNDFCKSFKCTTYVVQWGGSHVWKVGGKVFSIGTTNKLAEPAFTFKTSELNYYFLAESPGYQPAPYMASRGMKWIQQHNIFDDNGPMLDDDLQTNDLQINDPEINDPEINEQQRDEDLKYYLSESFRLVSLGLTKRLQKELGLNQTP
jgi:predicted DNA-binding protein (MmcQ/YjbR family)